MATIVFATNNQHKLKEVCQILPEWIRVKSLDEIGCEDELPETGNTLHANALQKARYVREKFGTDCFADDTGLEVDALDGEPGVFSARYSGKNASSADNIRKLLLELRGVRERSARFRTVIALVMNDEVYYFEGVVEGRIIDHESGAAGFGYDPVFVPVGTEKTFAEMRPEEKNAISHRAIAVRKLKEWIDVNRERLSVGFDAS